MGMHISNHWILHGFLQNAGEFTLPDSMSEFNSIAILPRVARVIINVLVRDYCVRATFIDGSILLFNSVDLV